MATQSNINHVTMEDKGNRVDALAKVTGKAKYTYDISAPKMIYAEHIRAPYADSELWEADLKAARAIKGVHEVVLYAEQTSRRRGPEPVAETVADVRKGAYGGQAVGHVCADSPALVEDAIAALKLEWDHGKPKTNLRREVGQVPDPDAEEKEKLNAIESKAAFTSEATYETQVQHHVSLETHGGVVIPGDGHADVYGSTQGTTSFRDGLDSILGLNKKEITMHCEYVGGGFGSKFGPGIEGQLAAKMAKKYNRPCKSMNSRKDECRDTGMRPGSLQYYKLAADKDGNILGGRYWAASSVGIFGGGGSINQVKFNLGDMVEPRRQEDVKLSSCAARPQRAPGWPQGMFALDSALDELAKACDMDPIKLRQKNEVSDYRKKQLDQAAKEIGWDRRKADGAGDGIIKTGFGVGLAEWHNSMFANASVDVRVHPDGKVEIRSGTQDIGTGNRTMLVDILAHQMGLDRNFVDGHCGNSEFPPGPASGGSVLARSIAPAIMDGGDKAKKAVLALAAEELGVEASRLSIKGNTIADSTNEYQIKWTDACKLMTDDFIQIMGEASMRDRDSPYRGEGESDGVCAAEVEVDTETGIVRVKKLVVIQQCGMPSNRKICESQIIGGAIQGLSYTLFEDRILNVDNGAMVNSNMEWYKIAGPKDMPEILPILDVPEGHDGVRSLGEPPIIGVPGAIANAVANAIGARVRSLPITPDKVLLALKEKGGVA